MYHARFKDTHYEAGYKYGSLLRKAGKKLEVCPTFPINNARVLFGEKCLEIYKKYYPQIVDEIRGIADGNEADFSFLTSMLFSMYCFDVKNRCSCFAFKNENNIVMGRNSDFLVSLENLYMNVIYKLDGGYNFNGNTTAFVEMEDGINEHGFAVGLTFVVVKKVKPGFNAGMLVRYLLEKCKTVNEAIDELKRLPIASGQTLTLIDKDGNMAVVECNCDDIQVILPNNNFVLSTNMFVSNEMKKYNVLEFDNWRALERYDNINKALVLNKDNYSVSLANDILSGKYGFICQYNRKDNADTVWSTIYDIYNKKIYRVEGNPSRKKYKIDERMKLEW